MDSLTNLLAGNHLLLLFMVIGLGYLIGSIRIFGFSLGVAAVLFVYAIGLQAGPGFFASFRSHGLRFSILAVTLLGVGGIVSVLLWWLMDFSAPQTAGLFCGALTNTPALAATIEVIKSMAQQLPAGSADLFAAV